MKIEATKPKLYKNYLIVAEAIEAPRLKAWRSKAIIYSRNSGKELKRLDVLKQGVFRYKRDAKEAGLKICRYWIDNHQSELDRLFKAPTSKSWIDR